MKYYLSSYNFGNEFDTLITFLKASGAPCGYIDNSVDFQGADPERREIKAQEQMGILEAHGIKTVRLDLRDYFETPEKLVDVLQTLGGLWVRGGNVFVLRQAMLLSGLDRLLAQETRTSFVYAGYSAGVCVLAPTLRPIALVDDANTFPYPQIKEQTWDGLGLLPYLILPHHRSDHPESEAIERSVAYCKEHDIPFKTLREGEVLLLN